MRAQTGKIKSVNFHTPYHKGLPTLFSAEKDYSSLASAPTESVQDRQPAANRSSCGRDQRKPQHPVSSCQRGKDRCLSEVPMFHLDTASVHNLGPLATSLVFVPLSEKGGGQMRRSLRPHFGLTLRPSLLLGAGEVTLSESFDTAHLW